MAPKKNDKKPQKMRKNAEKGAKAAGKAVTNPREKQEVITAAEFARRMEIDKSRVSRGIESKIISVSVRRNGGRWGILWPDGKTEWEGNVQFEHTPDPMKAQASREQGKANIGNPEARQFQLARAMKEEFAAKKAQVEFEALIGNLIPVDAVRREAIRTAKRTRDSFLAVPVKYAAQIAEMTDPHEVEQLLTDAIHDVLKDLKNVYSA